MTTEFSREVEWARRYMIEIGKRLKGHGFVLERMNDHPGWDLRRGFQLKTKTTSAGNYLFFSTLNRMLTISLCHEDKSFLGPNGRLNFVLCFLDNQLKEAAKRQFPLMEFLAKGVTKKSSLIHVRYEDWILQITAAFKWYEARWARFLEQRALIEKEMAENLLAALE